MYSFPRLRLPEKVITHNDFAEQLSFALGAEAATGLAQ